MRVADGVGQLPVSAAASIGGDWWLSGDWGTFVENTGPTARREKWLKSPLTRPRFKLGPSIRFGRSDRGREVEG
jgi:hypothetical protein